MTRMAGPDYMVMYNLVSTHRGGERKGGGERERPFRTLGSDSSHVHGARLRGKTIVPIFFRDTHSRRRRTMLNDV